MRPNRKQEAGKTASGMCMDATYVQTESAAISHGAFKQHMRAQTVSMNVRVCLHERSAS